MYWKVDAILAFSVSRVGSNRIVQSLVAKIYGPVERVKSIERVCLLKAVDKCRIKPFQRVKKVYGVRSNKTVCALGIVIVIVKVNV